MQQRQATIEDLRDALAQARNVKPGQTPASRLALEAVKADVRQALGRVEAEPSPEAPPPPAALPVFESRFSTLAGWHLQALPGRVSLLDGVARFEVRPGDVEPETKNNRAEVSGPTFNEGEDLYFASRFRVPGANTYAGGWGVQIIQQLHESDWGGSPGVAVMLKPDRTLYIASGDGDRTFWSGAKLVADSWYDLLYRVRLGDSQTGLLETWLNGEKVGSVAAMTIQASRTYLKAGVYRGSASTGISVVEYDRIAVGHSAAVVLP